MGAVSDALGGFFDEVIYTVAPRLGAKRIAARKARSAFESRLAKINGQSQKRTSRLRRRSFKQADPNENRDGRYITEDFEIRSLLEEQLTDLQTRAVGLYGENSIAHSVVESRVTYEVGAGIHVKPTVKMRKGNKYLTAERVKAINDEIKQLICSWSKHGVDRSRKLSLPMAQRLAVREFANEGECFILVGDVPFDGVGPFSGPVSTAIEFISPRRVETPPKFSDDGNVRLGIRYGRHGEVLGYYVRRSHPDDTGIDAEFEHDYFPRFDSAGQVRMIHVFDPLCAGQTRGLPYLTSALNKILDLDDMQEAEIIAKQTEACFGLIFKIAKNEDDNPSLLMDLAQAAAEEETAEGELMEKITPGFIQRIRDGDDVTTVNPQRPGSSYAPFVEVSIRNVAAAVNQPYEVIAKNFFRTTFASGRLAILDGELGYAMRRSIVIDMFLEPIHSRVIHTKVFENELYGQLDVWQYMQDPDWFASCEFYCKKMGLIDAEKEVKAYALGKEKGLLSESDFHEERGGDWEAARGQQYEENRRAIDDRLALEKYEMEQRKKLGLPEKDPASEDGGDPKPETKSKERQAV